MILEVQEKDDYVSLLEYSFTRKSMNCCPTPVRMLVFGVFFASHVVNRPPNPGHS